MTCGSRVRCAQGARLVPPHGGHTRVTTRRLNAGNICRIELPPDTILVVGPLQVRPNELALAAGRIATPQIRNRGTIGGNLLQDSRCPYYRQAWYCYRAGGIECYAHHGLNYDHAIFGGDRCWTVSPSLPDGKPDCGKPTGRQRC